MPDGPDPLAEGELFDGRYELIRYLGGGKFGEVWEAADKRLGRTVALKILAGTEEEAAWQEGTRLTALRSPNILPVHSAGLAVDVPYLDTELARQGTAKSAGEPHGMEPARAVRLTRGVLRGLALCHQQGVLHRDVKPANVFLTATGDAQLGDFGQAAVMDDTGTAKATGDPDVRSPETLKGARHDVRADVYAAGVTLYALLTGSLPHSIDAAGDFATHRANVLAGMPDIRDVAPHVSRSLARVVRRATAGKPAERYASATEFDAALGALPAVTWDFRPVPPHAGHDRCWEARRARDRHVVDVCAVGDGKDGFAVEVRHHSSRNRIKDLCATARNAAVLPKVLRAAFEGLRKL